MIMDADQFKLLNGKLDKIESAMLGDEYDLERKPGLIRIVMKHDEILFGKDGSGGIIGEISDTKDRKAKFDGVKLFVSAIAGGAVCVAAAIEVIDKCASWTSALFKK